MIAINHTNNIFILTGRGVDNVDFEKQFYNIICLVKQWRLSRPIGARQIGENVKSSSEKTKKQVKTSLSKNNAFIVCFSVSLYVSCKNAII